MNFLRIILMLMVFFIGNCFSNGKDYCINRVVLAANPRHGSHWIHHLVTEATKYSDPPVFVDYFYGKVDKRDFPHIQFRTVYHYLGEKIGNNHDLVIRTVRNPIDTIFSFYRLDNPLVEEIIPWGKFKFMVDYWAKFHRYWDSQQKVLTLRYEDFLSHPKFCLRKILRALKCQFNEEDIDRAVSKFSPRGAVYKHINHYTKKELKYIKNQFSDLLDKYGYEVPGL